MCHVSLGRGKPIVCELGLDIHHMYNILIVMTQSAPGDGMRP